MRRVLFGGNEWPRSIDLTLIRRLLFQLSYVSMYASRLNCHISDWRPPDTRLRHHYVETFTPTEQFSADIVILCEDLRDSHIIRERPGSWHRRKGLEPSSGGFGDRCSAIKLRLHMSPMAGFEPAHLVGTYFPPALPLSYIGVWPSFGTSVRGVEGTVWRTMVDSNHRHPG